MASRQPALELPSDAMLKASIRFDPALETNTRLLAQVLSIATAGPLVRNGEPKTGVSDPLASIEYTPTASNDLQADQEKISVGGNFQAFRLSAGIEWRTSGFCNHAIRCDVKSADQR